MKRTQNAPREEELLSATTPQPGKETPRVTLRIEELEPRLTPQSTAPILE